MLLQVAAASLYNLQYNFRLIMSQNTTVDTRGGKYTIFNLVL